MIHVRDVGIAVLLSALAADTGWAGVADTYPDLGVQARIDAAAQTAIEQRTFVGVAVGIVYRGQLVFSRGYGHASLELNVPVTPNTVFRLASLTKQFTAASVLLLAERHQLSLDDDLSKYCPQFPRGDRVTLRQLLHHTTGIKDYAEIGFEKIERQRSEPAQMVRYISHLGYDFEPGTAFHYSNSNYYLLGLIIEKASGRTFRQFTAENLFEPLEMTDTSVDDEQTIARNRAAGYSTSKESSVGFTNARFISMSVVYSAGGTRSTVRDLAKWNIALYGGKVLQSDSLRMMTEPGVLGDGRPASAAPFHTPDYQPPSPVTGWRWQDYAMGLRTAVLDGHRSTGHVGAIYGFNHEVLNFPDDDLTVIVLTNTDSDAGPLTRLIARALLTPALAAPR